MSLTPHQRVLGESRQQVAGLVVERYRAGESVRSIAADLGRSYGFVHQIVREAGEPLRARGGDTRSAEARARRVGSSATVRLGAGVTLGSGVTLGAGMTLAASGAAGADEPTPRPRRKPSSAKGSSGKKSGSKGRKKPAAKKPDTKKPVKKSDAKKSGAQKSDAQKSEAKKSGAKKSGSKGKKKAAKK
ncbi:helix-turn-helix domain-containing protein [Aestuariimicrobium soli]|uniref:helix-turn-helix domain-containing protein n=1 Tax=Aestuariimicrobium soli TaxID=2035834 RepID=UPI003EBCC6F3